MSAVVLAILWMAATVIAYTVARRLQQRLGARWFTLPVVSGTALVVLALVASRTPCGAYAEATLWLQRLAGPAVVALAVPLYRQMPQWRQRAPAVLAAVLSGCVCALVTGWLLGRLLGLPQALLLPRSATMPMAMAAAGQVGGQPALAFAALAMGLMGVATALVLPMLAHWL